MRNDPVNLEFAGDPAQRESSVRMVDEGLRKYGNFGAYGDLSAGLVDVLQQNRVKVSDQGSRLHVDIAPLSGAGHDFSFTVDKSTLRILDLVVGEITPPPGEK